MNIIAEFCKNHRFNYIKFWENCKNPYKCQKTTYEFRNNLIKHFLINISMISMLITKSSTKNVVSEVDENSEDQLEYASFSQKIGKSQERAKGERLILKIVSDTDGMLCSLDEALTKLIYVDKKKKRRVPWNCDLSIGSSLKIRISAFIYVRIFVNILA